MVEAKRVVFDLDETLIHRERFDAEPQLRPGAVELLTQLRLEGIENILWTTATRDRVEDVFRQFPQLGQQFTQVITANEALDYLKPLAQATSSQHRPTGVTVPFFKVALLSLSEGGGLGKYPPAVGSQILVDDANIAALTAETLGTFTWIDPRSREDDLAPTDWINRVIHGILGL